MVGIEQDPAKPGQARAVVAEFQEFDKARSIRARWASLGDIPVIGSESRRVGAFLQGKSIWTITQSDFGANVIAGLAETLDSRKSHHVGT